MKLEDLKNEKPTKRLRLEDFVPIRGELNYLSRNDYNWDDPRTDLLGFYNLVVVGVEMVAFIGCCYLLANLMGN